MVYTKHMRDDLPPRCLFFVWCCYNDGVVLLEVKMGVPVAQEMDLKYCGSAPGVVLVVPAIAVQREV